MLIDQQLVVNIREGDKGKFYPPSISKYYLHFEAKKILLMKTLHFWTEMFGQLFFCAYSLVIIINWDIQNVKMILLFFLLKIQFMRFLFVILFSNEIFKLYLEQEFHIEISNQIEFPLSPSTLSALEGAG